MLPLALWFLVLLRLLFRACYGKTMCYHLLLLLLLLLPLLRLLLLVFVKSAANGAAVIATTIVATESTPTTMLTITRPADMEITHDDYRSSCDAQVKQAQPSFFCNRMPPQRMAVPGFIVAVT